MQELNLLLSFKMALGLGFEPRCQGLEPCALPDWATLTNYMLPLHQYHHMIRQEWDLNPRATKYTGLAVLRYTKLSDPVEIFYFAIDSLAKERR